MQCVIPQPKDKGILLKDVLESEVDEKYYLSEKMVKWLSKHSEKRGTEFKKLDGKQKASCLTTTEAKQNLSNDYIIEACIKFGRTEEAKQIRKESMSNGKDYTPHTKKEITGLDFEKMNTLTTASNKDNLVMQIPEATKKGFAEVEPGQCFDMTMPDSKTRRGRLMEDKSNCLTASNFDFLKYTEDYKIRRLTPIECERLQTAPDNYTKEASDTQRYRMLGNGWTVDVIVHILKYILT
jgi:DNA (cytosine-5)-methyltransferase 3A